MFSPAEMRYQKINYDSLTPQSATVAWTLDVASLGQPTNLFSGNKTYEEWPKELELLSLYKRRPREGLTALQGDLMGGCSQVLVSLLKRKDLRQWPWVVPGEVWLGHWEEFPHGKGGGALGQAVRG